MPEFYRVKAELLLAGSANDRRRRKAAYRGAIEVRAISTPSCSSARDRRLGAALAETGQRASAGAIGDDLRGVFRGLRYP